MHAETDAGIGKNILHWIWTRLFAICLHSKLIYT